MEPQAKTVDGQWFRTLEMMMICALETYGRTGHPQQPIMGRLTAEYLHKQLALTGYKSMKFSKKLLREKAEVYIDVDDSKLSCWPTARARKYTENVRTEI